jgi:hypothetical protein
MDQVWCTCVERADIPGRRLSCGVLAEQHQVVHVGLATPAPVRQVVPVNPQMYVEAD